MGGPKSVGRMACPLAIDVDDRKTALPPERSPKAAITREPEGTITIGSFALAQQVLRSRVTEQAGFNAELVRRLPQRNISVLFMEGEAHRRQRAAAAPFFTPAAVATRYRSVMTDLSRELVAAFRRDGRAVLDEMTLALTVGVAAEIVGMTNSPGLGRRLSRIFELQSGAGTGLLSAAWYVARAQWSLLGVYLLDVRSAIRARRKTSRPDLISSLVARGWSQLAILTECVTYGTAGISTTREFIVVAALHLIEREPLRRRFLDGVHDDRVAILGEILRLEPAVSTLYRRSTGPLALDHEGGTEEIAPNSLIAIDLRSVNADPSAVATCPHQLRPDRPVKGAAGLMSFGDGPHRCPGASVALHETAVFLDHLLRVPGLRIEAEPAMSRNSASTGYVLRGAVVSTTREGSLKPGRRSGRPAAGLLHPHPLDRSSR